MTRLYAKLPKRRKKNNLTIIPSEDAIQMTLFEWARLHPILREYMYHVPNGGYDIPVYTRKKLSAMGLKPGVADIFIDYPVSPYHGFYLELKTLVGEVKEHQKAFLESRRKVGYKVGVARSFLEAKQMIEDYLNGKTRE